MSLAQVADYRCLIRRAAKSWRIKAARRHGTAKATRIAADALFRPSLAAPEFGAYALFIVAHL